MEQSRIKLICENARLTGEFIGTLKGILWWDIPAELKNKIENKIKELENGTK
jgi:hypothetical protein